MAKAKTTPKAYGNSSSKATASTSKTSSGPSPAQVKEIASLKAEVARLTADNQTLIWRFMGKG
jgi:hypothetical protein